VTVGDLLRHLPFRYEDRRAVRPVSEILEALPGTSATSATFRGRLSCVKRIHTRRRGFSVVRGTLADDTGSIPVVWFNRPYLAAQGLETGEWLLHGEVREGKGGRELLNPSCERPDEAVHGARIVPVYPAAGPVGPALLRRIFDGILAEIDLASQVPDPLPADLLDRRGFPALGEALRDLHLPEDVDVEALNQRKSPAHRRLIYQELLELQLGLAILRDQERDEVRTRVYRVDDDLRNVVRSVLPFPLTRAQKKALREIVEDLKGPRPMLRLLQGDVGSGKTIVAALALVVALENGYQGAFMAPTELVAEQHFASLRKILGGRYRIGLFTGSRRSRGDTRLRRELASGEIRLAVGTHALIQEGVEFRDLGLAVVDEQHRFGVLQRGRLREKGSLPDMLVMTATPIPRSLALAAWGDQEVSIIDELPPGRTPVETEVVAVKERRRIYRELREALKAGARAYVVFPMIEEGAAASVEEMGEKLREYLADIPSAVLHGRMPAPEREEVMRAFAAGEVRVLVSTTVIEVGVDVPEATWMVVESAERFGLAQLHQLRGRVGRGDRASRCVAIHGKLTEAGERRLEVFKSTTDGFRIAEEDLAIRGPGELLGLRQAGLPGFRLARLPEDLDLLIQARDDLDGAKDLL
jgi:ATP-dependent DNA helicase RecG